MRLSALGLSIVLLCMPASQARAQTGVLAAWTQIAADGTVLVRAITRERCAAVVVDGRDVPLHVRAEPTASFDVRTCEATVPRGAREVALFGRKLPLPPQHLRTVAVLGDTGCRIELIFFQGCNDAAKWPFPSLAKRIAAAHPDLVVHVGDYYYRETACLVPECAGSPHGDNWPVWNADFFGPAAPMLGAATLLAVRGNHEDCGRGGEGWDRFLSIYAYGACATHEAAYAARVGNLRFFVLDSSTALDARPSVQMVPFFRRDFARLRALPAATTWLLTHRPLWGIDGTLTGATLPINRTLEAAEGNPRTLPIELAVSGHIHLFEALGFADRRPPQVILGTGGDTLSNLPGHFFGERIDGTRVVGGAIRHGFGFALFHLDTKSFDVFDRAGVKVVVCRYNVGSMQCHPERSER